MLEIMQGVSTRAISKRKKSLQEKMKSSQHISNGTIEVHQPACNADKPISFIVSNIMKAFNSR
jgi:hypothetical protein